MTPPSEDQWVRLYPRHGGRAVRLRRPPQRGATGAWPRTWSRKPGCGALARWRRRGLPREPQAWLRTTARNLLWNHFRRRRPDALAPEELDLTEAALRPETPRAAALLQWGLARLRRGPGPVARGLPPGRQGHPRHRGRERSERTGRRGPAAPVPPGPAPTAHPLPEHPGDPNMSTDHRPDPAFVDHLEWQLRSALRRRDRFAEPAGRSVKRGLRTVVLVAVSLLTGAAGGHGHPGGRRGRRPRATQAGDPTGRAATAGWRTRSSRRPDGR